MICEGALNFSNRSSTRPFFDALELPTLHSLALLPSGITYEATPEQLFILPLLQRWGDRIRTVDFGRGKILNVAHLIQVLEMTPNVEELTVDLSDMTPGDNPTPNTLATIHDGSRQQPRPLFKNAILRKFEVGVDGQLQPLCPNLRSIRFSHNHWGCIAAKAVARVVRSRQEGPGVTQLQSVIVRFQVACLPWGWRSTDRERWRPPPRWQESKINALALVERIIRVEWPNGDLIGVLSSRGGTLSLICVVPTVYKSAASTCPLLVYGYNTSPPGTHRLERLGLARRAN
ncbi:hypothetical protein BKA70DRAFT_1246671 [Coprinopsis sp. MPI-PUGE-AT-0042]|nr:hypothetical protein BKA70DRAFT_1246671 [Coprinopsis sp. MPI-PUGE-AT-0042]